MATRNTLLEVKWVLVAMAVLTSSLDVGAKESGSGEVQAPPTGDLRELDESAPASEPAPRAEQRPHPPPPAPPRTEPAPPAVPPATSTTPPVSPIGPPPTLAPSPSFEVSSAETPPNLWSKRPLSLEVHLGFGTPVGALGIVLEYLVTPAFSVGVGAGIGSGPSTGSPVHAAIVARVRPVHGERNALVLGAALSTGGYERFELGGGDSASAEWAHFLQAEVGWERRSQKGMLVRLSLGFAAMLNPGALQCSAADAPVNSGPVCNPFPNGDRSEVIPTADFTLGHSF